ncbi:unnamed protein product [Rhizophagus irregularis]|nr:unnamed protein product [Rhizophagus irregularis]
MRQKYKRIDDIWYESRAIEHEEDEFKYFTNEEALLLRLNRQTEWKLLKLTRRKRKPQLIIIDGVDGVGKSTIVENLIQRFQEKGMKVVFNTFKRRRKDDERFSVPSKKNEWLFRKQVVEEINRRIVTYNDEDIIILDKSPYSEYFYQKTQSFDRGLITPYGNHKMEGEIFKYKNLIDNAIVIFLENDKCWENYIGRETGKSSTGHQASYATLNKEEYMDMVKMFKQHQNVYENKNKYKSIKIQNDDKNLKYENINEVLYRVKNGKKLKVIKDHEYEGLMYMMHDHELSGHFGIKATQDKIKEKYYWKGMIKDIEAYVKSCDKCQRRGKPIGKNELNPIKVKEPFYQIGIDFVGPLPSTKRRNRYILVAMDYFTKWPEAKATKRDTAEEVVKFLYEEIICRHGCPQKIISDRGTHFNNKIVSMLMERFDIKHNLSTSYHPQMNGLVERFNKTLCESLARLQEDNNWDEKIPSVLFAYRNKIQSSTKVKPFYLVYGRQARFLTDENYEEFNETQNKPNT